MDIGASAKLELVDKFCYHVPISCHFGVTVKKNESWLLWKRPLKIQKSRFRSFIYSHSGTERESCVKIHPCNHGRPKKGQGGSPDPLDFDINFSHIITVAPRVEIQMHFWKGAEFDGSFGHPMTKIVSASGGLCPLTPKPGAMPLDPAVGSAPRPLL